jgi:biopolymer transport protein ExbD
MIATEKKYGWCRNGLRIRYAPKARICKGLITSAPYVDVAFILVIFVLLSTRAIMGPGILITLPTTTEAVGLARGVTVVIRAYDASGTAGGEEMVFFDHDPFLVGDESQTQNLQLRLSAVAKEHQDMPLLIESDVNVRHGTTMLLCDMAREAGFKEVIFAMRESEMNATD